jgi:hypothetical protein
LSGIPSGDLACELSILFLPFLLYESFSIIGLMLENRCPPFLKVIGWGFGVLPNSEVFCLSFVFMMHG